MLKRRAHAAGLVPELFSGHSLRSGFATTAAQSRRCRAQDHAAKPVDDQQGHAGYIQEGELFVDNPSAKLGL